MGATAGAQVSPEQLLADLLEGRLGIQEACDWVAGLLSTRASAAQLGSVSPAAFAAHFLDVIRADAGRLFKEHLQSPHPTAGAAAALQAHEPQSAAVTPDIQSSELFPKMPLPAPKVCSHLQAVFSCCLLPLLVTACLHRPETQTKVHTAAAAAAAHYSCLSWQEGGPKPCDNAHT